MPSSATVALWTTALSTSEAVVDRFTTNAICRRNNCVNPVFPGLQDLQKLQVSSWSCPDPDFLPQLQFCSGAIQHRVALMGVAGSAQEVVRKQEDMASTAYFYHLSGMKLDPWENRDPGKRGGCVKAIWSMVCSTYLPKAPVTCKKGESVPYLLACRNECRGYVDACAVECCDESVQCNPEQGVHFVEPFENFTGYSPFTAPNAECTGSGAGRSAGVSLLLLLGLAGFSTGDLRPGRSGLLLGLLAVAMSLQGCDIMASHAAGTWESRPSYLMNFAVRSTQVEANTGVTQVHSKTFLNSCSVPDLGDAQKCNGHGVCKTFASGLAFCECDSGYSDPECRTERKSQRTAFLLSLFTGFLGLDRFYLGELSAGTLKLATLGGVGIWWMWDIVRTGAAPIYTRYHGRLAADLPHFVFVILAVLWVALLGYFIFGVVGAMWHQSSILNKALTKVEKIQHHLAKQRLVSQNEEGVAGMPSKTTYHVAAPYGDGSRDFYGSMAETPAEVKLAAYKNPMSPYYLYAKASEQPNVKSSGVFSRSPYEL